MILVAVPNSTFHNKFRHSHSERAEAGKLREESRNSSGIGSIVSRIGRVVLTLLTGLSATGCMPKMSVEQIAAYQPERPHELDRLDMLLGDWETTGTIELAVLDQPITTSGRNKAQWTMDGRVLEDQADLDMGPFGRVTGKSLWTFDSNLRKFRMWWFDSLGETSEVVATFHEESQTWKMKAKGQKYGRRTSGIGTIRRIDNNTLEWTWNESSASGLITFAKMRGTSRRVEPAR